VIEANVALVGRYHGIAAVHLLADATVLGMLHDRQVAGHLERQFPAATFTGCFAGSTEYVGWYALEAISVVDVQRPFVNGIKRILGKFLRGLCRFIGKAGVALTCSPFEFDSAKSEVAQSELYDALPCRGEAIEFIRLPERLVPFVQVAIQAHPG